MQKDIKIRITKCYLIEICDKDGKELISDFCFGNYHESKEQGERMLKAYKAGGTNDRCQVYRQ